MIRPGAILATSVALWSNGHLAPTDGEFIPVAWQTESAIYLDKQSVTAVGSSESFQTITILSRPALFMKGEAYDYTISNWTIDCGKHRITHASMSAYTLDGQFVWGFRPRTRGESIRPSSVAGYEEALLCARQPLEGGARWAPKDLASRIRSKLLERNEMP